MSLCCILEYVVFRSKSTASMSCIMDLVRLPFVSCDDKNSNVLIDNLEFLNRPSVMTVKTLLIHWDAMPTCSNITSRGVLGKGFVLRFIIGITLALMLAQAVSLEGVA